MGLRVCIMKNPREDLDQWFGEISKFAQQLEKHNLDVSSINWIMMMHEKDSLAGAWNRVRVGTLMREIKSSNSTLTQKPVGSYQKISNEVPHYYSTKWEHVICKLMTVFRVWDPERECLLAFRNPICTGIVLLSAAQVPLQIAVWGNVIPQGTLYGGRKSAVFWMAHLFVFKGL